MSDPYLEEPLLKEWDLEDGTHVELRDAAERVKKDRTKYDNSIAGMLKTHVSFVRDDNNSFPEYIDQARRHWLYHKNGKTISVLEVIDSDWNFEIYPFDNCVELDNDPYCSGIERYETEAQTHEAVLRLLKKIK